MGCVHFGAALLQLRTAGGGHAKFARHSLGQREKGPHSPIKSEGSFPITMQNLGRSDRKSSHRKLTRFFRESQRERNTNPWNRDRRLT